MKPTIIEQVNGAVSSRTKVRLPATKEETDELRAALAVVDKFKKKALQVGKTSEKYADWTMVGYAVKNDCVEVTLKQGMCG